VCIVTSYFAVQNKMDGPPGAMPRAACKIPHVGPADGLSQVHKTASVTPGHDRSHFRLWGNTHVTETRLNVSLCWTDATAFAPFRLVGLTQRTNPEYIYIAFCCHCSRDALSAHF
jgi:hypothetical protein